MYAELEYPGNNNNYYFRFKGEAVSRNGAVGEEDLINYQFSSHDSCFSEHL